MTPLTYEALVAELFPRLTGGIRWGLDRTERLLAAVGHPERSYRTFHVGGTNGKGSVAATLAAILRASGERCGLYSSPHLCTFRERVRIDGRAIEERALLAAAQTLWPAIEREQPSFFEATTAIAFLALAESGITTAVVEVGLGGRLDATNVIQPDLTILTNVSLDHVELLGDTVTAVAREKAGIIKRRVPVITGATGDDELAVFTDAARAADADLTTLPSSEPRDVRVSVDGSKFEVNTKTWGSLQLHTPLVGVHQARNAALAVVGLDVLAPAGITAAAIVQGVAEVQWPGRMQIEHIAGGVWVFDVAHNVAGVAALTAALDALPLPRPHVAIAGVLGDKDWRQMLGPIHAWADHLLLTLPPTAPVERSWDPHGVLSEVRLERAQAEPDLIVALERAHAAAGSGTVLVTGSFHTVGDALIALRRAPDGADVALPPPSCAA